MISQDQNSTPCDQDHLRKRKLNETPIIVVQFLLTFLYNFRLCTRLCPNQHPWGNPFLRPRPPLGHWDCQLAHRGL